MSLQKPSLQLLHQSSEVAARQYLRHNVRNRKKRERREHSHFADHSLSRKKRERREHSHFAAHSLSR
ncbi:hypothetical protein SUGI_0861780 [Cryptomeria japonica]|nr:hypothetical protein SUGI_0861780 [Cryptomeria japonica]